MLPQGEKFIRGESPYQSLIEKNGPGFVFSARQPSSGEEPCTHSTKDLSRVPNSYVSRQSSDVGGREQYEKMAEKRAPLPSEHAGSTHLQ